MSIEPTDISLILAAVRSGEPDAERRLYTAVYDELRRIASAKMAREARGQTLQTTALVHEAYLRLMGRGKASWENRRHFFGAAANAMRQILVESARRRKAEIHGGGLSRVPLDDSLADGDPRLELLAIDAALVRLAQERPRVANVVVHRYFLGFTIQETADTLGIGTRTVENDWAFAKAWLHRQISNGNSD